MVGMNNQQTTQSMHIQRVGFKRLVRHSEAHAQEVVHIAARVIGVQHRLIATTTEDVRHNCTGLGHDDLGGLIKLVVVRNIGGVRVERGQRIDGGGKHAHRVSGARERTHEGTEVFANHRLVIDVRAELLILSPARQLAVAQQPRHFQKIGVLAQLLDGVATVAQNRMLAVDVGDFRFALCSGEESGVERYPAVIAQLGNDDAIRPRTSLHHGQVELVRIDIKLCRCHSRTFLFMNHLPQTLTFTRSRTLVFRYSMSSVLPLANAGRYTKAEVRSCYQSKRTSACYVSNSRENREHIDG